MVKYLSFHNSPFALLRTPCWEIHQHLTLGSSLQHALDDWKMEKSKLAKFHNQFADDDFDDDDDDDG